MIFVVTIVPVMTPLLPVWLCAVMVETAGLARKLAAGEKCAGRVPEWASAAVQGDLLQPARAGGDCAFDGLYQGQIRQFAQRVFVAVETGV